MRNGSLNARGSEGRSVWKVAKSKSITLTFPSSNTWDTIPEGSALRSSAVMTVSWTGSCNGRRLPIFGEPNCETLSAGDSESQELCSCRAALTTCIQYEAATPDHVSSIAAVFCSHSFTSRVSLIGSRPLILSRGSGALSSLMSSHCGWIAVPCGSTFPSACRVPCLDCGRIGEEPS